MNWNARYRVTANLHLQFRQHGKWAVCPAASRDDLEIEGDAIAIL